MLIAHLEAFLSVAERRSVSRAAEALYRELGMRRDRAEAEVASLAAELA